MNILREAGRDPGPTRGKGTWADFIRRHSATLWASNFAGVKTWTRKGLVDVSVLFFLHVGMWKVYVSGITANPTGQWVTQQARNASMEFAEWGLECSHLLIDHDTKYVAGFDAVLEADGVEVKRVGAEGPQPERLRRAVGAEFVPRMLGSLRRPRQGSLASPGVRILGLYIRECPQQGVGNVPLGDSPPSADALPAVAEEPVTLPFPKRVECRERLGGLLKHFHRAA